MINIPKLAPLSKYDKGVVRMLRRSLMVNPNDSVVMLLEDAKNQGMPIGMLYGDDFTAFIDETEQTMISLKPLFGWE